MALMEGSVDLAAIMVRSGFLAAEPNSRQSAEQPPASQQARNGEAAAREAYKSRLAKQLKTAANAAGIRYAQSSSNGAVTGTIAASTSRHASTQNGRYAMSNGVASNSAVLATAANGPTIEG